MNIALYAHNTPDSYSGGRLYTMFLAIASAEKYKVYYITDAKPLFIRDFSNYKNFNNITFLIDENFTIPSNIKFDIVIIVPDLRISKDWFRKFYLSALNNAYKDNAKIIFINFETPNWFNKISTNIKDPKLWKYWLKTSKYADGVLSFTKIGKKYAIEYFTNKHLSHHYCYPAINQIIADKYKNKIKTNNNILVFARFADIHKGSNYLLNIIDNNIKNYKLKIVIGRGTIPEIFHKKIIEKAKKYNVEIEYLFKITDEQKFKEIASSKLLLFLSNFEGFGYPPVEALYMGVPVVAFYLDVLYEVSGDNIVYINNIEEFNKLDLDQIGKKKIFYNKNIEIENYIVNINKIFTNIINQSKKIYIKKLKLYFLNIYYNIINIDIIKFINSINYKINAKRKLSYLTNYQNVFIFGIGEYSKTWTNWCNKNNKNIIGYIVTNKQKQTTFLEKPIFLPKEIKKQYHRNCIFIIATINKDSALEILNYLKETKTKNIFFCSNSPNIQYKISTKRIVKESLEILLKKFLNKII